MYLPVLANNNNKKKTIRENCSILIDMTSLCGVLVIVHSKKKSNVLVIYVWKTEVIKKSWVVLTLIKNA